MSPDNQDGPEFNELAYIKCYLGIPCFHLTGFHLKRFSMMGDRVATSIIKALYPDVRVDEVMLKKILAAVCASLEYPSATENESDRTPAVTMLLLEALMTRAESAEQKNVIQSSMDEVKKYTEQATYRPDLSPPDDVRVRSLTVGALCKHTDTEHRRLICPVRPSTSSCRNPRT